MPIKLYLHTPKWGFPVIFEYDEMLLFFGESFKNRKTILGLGGLTKMGGDRI